MQETEAITTTSRRESRALLALMRRRSMSSLMAESFSMNVSVAGT